MDNSGVHDASGKASLPVKKEGISTSPLHGGDSGIERQLQPQTDTKMEFPSEEDDGSFHFHPPDKKRRLTPEQVKFLEKSFELENKLEPERKARLAGEVGLQPRQVAIWFQNRRARYKTKLLEKEYGSLKESYDKLKAEYSALSKENEEMRNEINQLSKKMGVGSDSDPISPPENSAIPAPAAAASSARSDVLDSDSPHCRDATYSAQLDPTAESSQEEEEEDSNCKFLLAPPLFPKLEFESHDDLQPNCCNLGFPVQNQGTWFWHY